QHDALLDEVRLRPALFHAVRRDALVRALALDVAASEGSEATPALLTQVLDAFRRRHALERPERMAAWLDEQGLSVEEFSQLLEEEAALQQVLPVYEADLDRFIGDVLRLRGEYGALGRRMQHKHEVLTRAGMANPTLALASLDEAALWRWLCVERFGADEVPRDLEAFATEAGFKDADSLRRVALREYVYLSLTGEDVARHNVAGADPADADRRGAS
ncbi:MAG TPA: hypothetical protein VFV33_27520, partial [Gemmatimonadaceae bacterium]|nr:hypothetical protein [Gemmatimonadaceae bacterium]